MNIVFPISYHYDVATVIHGFNWLENTIQLHDTYAYTQTLTFEWPYGYNNNNDSNNNRFPIDLLLQLLTYSKPFACNESI